MAPNTKNTPSQGAKYRKHESIVPITENPPEDMAPRTENCSESMVPNREKLSEYMATNPANVLGPMAPKKKQKIFLSARHQILKSSRPKAPNTGRPPEYMSAKFVTVQLSTGQQDRINSSRARFMRTSLPSGTDPQAIRDWNHKGLWQNS